MKRLKKTMRNVMSWIKVIFLNIFITFSLLGMLLLAPPAVYYVYSFVSGTGVIARSLDTRANLDLYSNIEWADRHFDEFNRLNTT